MGIERVGGIFRYPVKSLQGEQLAAASFDLRGVVEDRVWAVYAEDGGIGSGKTTRRFRRIDGLLSFRAVGRDGHAPLVVGPDGREHRAGDPGTDRAMSEALGQHVELRREASIAHHDESQVHVVTTSSLRRLVERVGRPVDVQRLRANLVLDLDLDLDADDLDDEATGRPSIRLALGSRVVLRLGPPMPRCRMVDLEPSGRRAHPPILTAIAARGAPVFGLQALVEVPGRVRAGDPVRRID